MRRCVCGNIKAHVFVFTIFMNRKYATPTVFGATSAFCAVKTDRRLYAFLINDAIATAGLFRHGLRNSRENLNSSVVASNRDHHVKCDPWAIRLYETTSYMGCYFDYCRGVYRELQVIMFFDGFVVQVGEVREAEEMRRCLPMALSCRF